jgi:hypothetical protein
MKTSNLVLGGCLVWLVLAGCASDLLVGRDQPKPLNTSTPPDAAQPVPDAGNPLPDAGNPLPDAGKADANSAAVVPVCPVSPELDAFFQSYADAVCPSWGNCCSTLGQGDYDIAKCKADVMATFRGWAGASCPTFRRTQAAACLELLREPGCPPTDNGKIDKMRVTCWGAWTGVLAPGSACNTNFDCAAPANGNPICESINDGPYRCAVQHMVTQAGAPCGGYDECDPTLELFCANDGVCKNLSKVGERCESGSYSCGHNADCDFDTLVCEPLVPAGGACKDHLECEEGALCENGTCVVRGFGAACDDDTVCQFGLCVDGKCVPADWRLGAITDPTCG